MGLLRVLSGSFTADALSTRSVLGRLPPSQLLIKKLGLNLNHEFLLQVISTFKSLSNALEKYKMHTANDKITYAA